MGRRNDIIYRKRIYEQNREQFIFGVGNKSRGSLFSINTHT